MFKKNIRLLIILVLALAILPIQSFAATTLSSPYTNLSASVDGDGSGEASAGAVSMKVSGGWLSAKNGTLTLTNSGSEAAMLSFSYSVNNSNYNTFTIAGSTASASGTYNAELLSGDSIAVYLKVPAGKSTTVSLTNVKLEVASAANVTLSHNGLGSISVGGTTVSSGTTVEVAAEGTTLAATPSSGATFLGWINTVDNSVYSTSASLSYVPTGDISLKAIFAHADHEATFWGSSKSYLFESLNDAITHATGASNKTIVLAANGTLPAGSYSIPSGVTLLIPFDSDGTCYTTAPGYVSDSWSKPSAYRTLTVAEGANVSVNGNISVSAKVSAKMGYSGAPTSSYGHISMNSGSSITVNSGGNLYAWGYISGSGNVTIESGASVYESFQVVDWRGGTASSGMLNNSQKVFPMTQYYIQNVEAPMTLKSGASEKCSMVADIISVRQVTVSYLGTSGCMFNLTNGSVTKSYDGNTDRLVLDVNGDLSVSQTTINLILSYSIKTANYVLPFNSNIIVNVNNGGTIVFEQTASLLPGTRLNIAEGATAKLGSGAKLFVYDEDEWKSNYFVYSSAYFRPIRYAHSQKYTRSNNADIIDAVIKVNGTLDASAGYLYTTDGGANICSTGKGVVKLQTPETSPTLYEATQSGTSISYVSIPVTAAQLKHADGSYLSSGANEYTYDLNAGKWRCANHTYPENSHVCSVCGYDAGHTEETISGKAATCTENGLTDGKKCTVCGEITVEQEIIETLGHTYDIVVTAPTCTEEGYTTYSCTVCSDTQVTDKVAASGHSMEWSVVTLPTCETDGSQHGKCKVCGHEEDKVEAATGHDMQETTAAVAPTCTETGKTAVLTCANNCGKTEGGEEVAATGHTVVTDAAVAPTCTATGKTEGSHCSVCNEVLVAQTVVDKLGHSYNDGEVTTPATCTEKGVKTYTCGTCGDKYTEEIAATGHSYTSVVTAPTCEAEGYTTHTCACGDSKVDTYVDALGHDYELIDSKSATCTEDGFETYACKNDASHTYTKTLTKTGHDYKSEVTAPTCTEKGYTTHTCACGDKYVDTYVDALGHSYNAEVTTEATCTEKGVKTYTCSACGGTYTEEIAATGHSYTSVVTAPTCEAKGYTTYTCSACGDTYEADEVAALGHKMQETSKEVPATCTTDGKTAVYTCANGCGTIEGGEVLLATGHNMQKSADAVAPSCTVAGKTETKTCANGCGLTEGGIEVPALGHKYDAVVTAPTCTEAGYTTYTCSVCNHTYKADEVAATGHTVVVDEAVPPDCENTGLTEGSHCSVCGEVIVAQTVVDALGHKHETVVTAPTCTEEGYTTYTCTVCGDSYVADEVAALGHNYEAVVTAPTCTEAGYTTYTCHCGHGYVADEVAATGHTYKSVVTAPTCTEAGYTTYTCHCGDSYVADEVAATGHTYTSKVTTDPTCTEEGVETFTCQNDPSHTYAEPIAKLGHDEVAHEAKAPTCTEIGWDAYVTCSRCDYTTYVEKAALGHDEVAHEAKTPTCTEIGWDAYETCSRCDYTTYVEKAALGHDEVAHEAKAPTCTEIGWDAYETCSRCDYTTYVEKAALGHAEVAHEAKAPTCTEIGWDAYVTCSRCDYTTYVEKAALGHDEIKHDAKAPTCTEIGWDAYETCSRCDYTTRGADIPATGHVHNVTYGGGYVLVDGDDLAQLVPTTFIQKVGVEELMRKIDFCAAYAGERLSDDITGTHFWDFVGILFNGEGAGLSNDELANAMVLYVADYADGVDKQTIVDLLRENTSLTTDMNNENFQQDLTYAALIYGMYVSYAYDSGDAALIEKTETVSEVMSDRTNADFIAYIEQDNVNFEGFKAALRIVSASTDSVEAVRKLLSEGFNSDDLKTLINTEITENVTYTRVENTETHKITTKCAVCETTLSETTTADCVDSDDDNLCDKCGEAVASSTIDFAVEIVGTRSYGAVVTEPVSGWMLGSNTFSVTCDQACAVVVSYDDGITYTLVEAVEPENGSKVYPEDEESTTEIYNFTIDNLTAETIVKVMLRGDFTGDGRLRVDDVSALRRAQSRAEPFTGQLKAMEDLTGDGRLRVDDVSDLRRAQSRVEPLGWK